LSSHEKLPIRTSAHPGRRNAPNGLWRALGLVLIIVLFVQHQPGTEKPPRRPGLAVVVGRTTPVHCGPGTAAGLRRTKGMRRGSPTQRQGRNHLSQLPPYRRGGRPPARLAQDRVPLGQGRQATLPEDPGRPPPLPSSRDPPAGRGTSRRSHSLSGAVRSFRPGWQTPTGSAAPATCGDQTRSQVKVTTHQHPLRNPTGERPQPRGQPAPEE
jgi:hypothetical protein